MPTDLQETGTSMGEEPIGMRQWWVFAILLGGGGCSSFHAVEDNQFYRARSLSETELDERVESNGIKTVINLSGFRPSEDWYRAEYEVCKKRELRLIDLEIDPKGPGREEVIQLLEAFENAPRPILVHANHESQGVGLAAALYRLAEKSEDKRAARKELPFWMWRRSPFERFRPHDQFLYEWRDKDEFYATYGIEDPQVRRRNFLQPPTSQENSNTGRSMTAKEPPKVALGIPF